MGQQERPPEEIIYAALDDLGRKLDTMAGALATIANGHTTVLDHVAGSEARRSHDSVELAHRLEALERQVLSLGHRDAGHDAADRALSLEVLARMTEALDHLETRAMEPPDLTPVLAQIAAVTNHTEVALVGVLRLIDQRLAALRSSLTDALPPAGSSLGGFEAGAVMGAAQVAWNRLEQRLDNEFDDLGRQLQGLASLVADVITATEGLANRPVVTGDQFRKAASAMKDTVVSANRSRRDRRGGPKGLDPG